MDPNQIREERRAFLEQDEKICNFKIICADGGEFMLPINLFSTQFEFFQMIKNSWGRRETCAFLPIDEREGWKFFLSMYNLYLDILHKPQINSHFLHLLTYLGFTNHDLGRKIMAKTTVTLENLESLLDMGRWFGLPVWEKLHRDLQLITDPEIYRAIKRDERGEEIFERILRDPNFFLPPHIPLKELGVRTCPKRHILPQRPSYAIGRYVSGELDPGRVLTRLRWNKDTDRPAPLQNLGPSPPYDFFIEDGRKTLLGTRRGFEFYTEYDPWARTLRILEDRTVAPYHRGKVLLEIPEVESGLNRGCLTFENKIFLSWEGGSLFYSFHGEIERVKPSPYPLSPRDSFYPEPRGGVVHLHAPKEEKYLMRVILNKQLNLWERLGIKIYLGSLSDDNYRIYPLIFEEEEVAVCVCSVNKISIISLRRRNGIDYLYRNLKRGAAMPVKENMFWIPPKLLFQ